jgi:hypothetical protein
MLGLIALTCAGLLLVPWTVLRWPNAKDSDFPPGE